MTCRCRPLASASNVTRQRGLLRKSSCMVTQVSNGTENCFGRIRTSWSSRWARRLAGADAGTGADECELSQVAVRPHRKGFTARAGQGFAGVADERRRLVIANERMRCQIGEAAGRAVLREITLMGVQSHLNSELRL